MATLQAVNDSGKNDDRLYSIEDSAKFLGGLSESTINAWLAKGRLKRSKVGSRTMIRQSELLKMIEDGGKSPARNSKLSGAGK